MDTDEGYVFRGDVLRGLIQLERKRAGMSYTFEALSAAVMRLRTYLTSRRGKSRSITGVDWEILDAMSQLTGKPYYWRERISARRVSKLHADLKLEVAHIEKIVATQEMSMHDFNRALDFLAKLSQVFSERSTSIYSSRRDPYIKYAA